VTVTPAQTLRRAVDRAVRDAAPTPLPNNFWVLPGRLLAGEHPFGANPLEAHERLARLKGAGFDAFLDLTEIGEMPGYWRLLPRMSEYRRFAIVDGSLPSSPRDMQAIQAYLAAALERDRRVYVHCRAGIGRTGLVIGCYLAELGFGGERALRTLNALWGHCARAASWPRVPQTDAQTAYVLAWPGSSAGGA
jgi:hypothetical protein